MTCTRRPGKTSPKNTKKAASPKKAKPTVYQNWHGVPPNWPAQIVMPPPPPPVRVIHPVNGFDSCTAPTLATMRVRRRQYARVGVYIGGANSAGIDDMQAAAAANKARFTRPDAIWIALWDGKPTLDDGTLDWPIGDREKQHAGNLYWTVGGIRLSIDRDVVAGPMAR